MPGYYLEKLQTLATTDGNFGLPLESLSAELTIINSKTSKYFALISPVEFLSMMHYKVALLLELDPTSPELSTLVPFLQVARFYFENEKQIPIFEEGRAFVLAWDHIAAHKRPALMQHDVHIDFPECFGPEDWADNLFAYIQDVLPQQVQPTPSFSVFLLLSVLSTYLECLHNHILTFDARINLDLAAAGVLSMLIKHPATSAEEKSSYAEAILKLLDDKPQPAKSLILTGNQIIELPDSTWSALKTLQAETGYKPDRDANFLSAQYQTFDLLAHACSQLGRYEEFRTAFKKADNIFKIHGSSLLINDTEWFSEIFNPVQQALVKLNREFGRREKGLASGSSSVGSLMAREAGDASHVASSLNEGADVQLSHDDRHPGARKAPRHHTRPAPKAKKPYARKKGQEITQGGILDLDAVLEEVVIVSTSIAQATHKNRRFATPLSLKERDELLLFSPAICLTFEGEQPLLPKEAPCPPAEDHRLVKKICAAYAKKNDPMELKKRY